MYCFLLQHSIIHLSSINWRRATMPRNYLECVCRYLHWEEVGWQHRVGWGTDFRQSWGKTRQQTAFLWLASVVWMPYFWWHNNVPYSITSQQQSVILPMNWLGLLKEHGWVRSCHQMWVAPKQLQRKPWPSMHHSFPILTWREPNFS